MKPNFALILSMDGIALLQRASPGWAIVGEAYPDGDNLADDMARLRAAADRLAPGEATFKVVIPNDQIRYVSIPAGAPDPMARQRAVETALDGATPYALDELAVDHAVSGGSLNIAAVALETLQEADEFARSFGFDPLCFVAMPEDRDYIGEPFFGTAHDVPDDVAVVPDSTAIRVTGHVRPADLEDKPAPKLVEVPKTEIADPLADDGAAVAGPSDPDATTDAAGPVSFSTRRARSGEDAGDVPPAPKADRSAAPRGDAPRITFAEPEAGTSPAPVVVPPRDLQPEEMSASLKADSDDGVMPKPSPMAGIIAAAGAFSGRVGAAMAARRAARTEAREAARAEAARKAEEAAQITPEAPTKALGIANPTAPAAVPAPQDAPGDTQQDAPKPKGRKGKSKANAAVAAAAAPAPAASEPVAPTPTFEKVVANLHSAEDRIPGALTAEERRAEEERMTVFGARGGSYESSGGGSAGVVTAVIIAVFVLGTAAWAMLFSDGSLSALVGGDSPQEETVAAVEPRVIEDSFVPPAPGDPEDAAEAEDNAPDATPDTAPESQAEAPAPTAEDAAVAQALAAEETTEAPPEAPTDAPATEDAAPSEEPVSPLIVTEAAEAEPEPEPTADATDGTLTPEEEARYAASGIWQESPDGIAATGDAATGTGTDGSADPDAPPDRSPSVDLAALTPDLRPAPPAPPPVFGQRFDMDARGLVIATPEGAETPSGVLAFSGPPPVEPPARPGDPEPTAAPEPEASPQDDAAATPDTIEEPQPDAAQENSGETFAAVRPRQRPVTEPEVAADGTAGDRADDDVTTAAGASLAGAAIGSRTETTALIPDENRASIAAGLAGDDPTAAEGEEAEIEEASAALVPEFPALRPLQRPGNIGELAAAARATPIPTPSIAPSGPTAVSVARQATVRSAIDLTEVNLIGVYGQPSDRRALVRLSNGRYRKVKVGDRIDGGRVLAIGDDTLRYQKNGRNMTLAMPSG
ncbi:hypothetical protein [Pseudooceanicola onchidii]|uniref:hypothetical protein n=1 Tax=Pseudooceanicola onchidii TaxID=2562279 RepID=UPI0010AA777E|nr:hypothetical protein [Pseudooceanicola onchidii]